MILSALLSGNAFSHSGKPKFHVIIDTDGAVDDMRAISTLLSGNDIRVLAITCSQGTLMPETVFSKVNSLLIAFHHEGIPVGISEEINSELPDWASLARDIPWAGESNLQNLNPATNSIELLSNTLESYQNKVTLIALGSLKTYADWIKANGNEAEKIERIIWYNNHKIEEGFNYKVSPESVDFIRQSGIPLEVVATNSDYLSVNEDYLKHIHSAHSIYASQIEKVHSRASLAGKTNAGNLRIWDDLVPLYLTMPLFFEIETKQDIKLASLNQTIPQDFIFETIGKLLMSASPSNNRVFTEFPTDTALYKPEYARMLQETIEKFGLIEWKAISMTNEIHGHTGIYSIIGAKMGVRAMEYFNVGVNNLEVETFAGSVPPLSCFNDGLQISTGATIGQGLITISDSISTIPSAIFRFNNQKVHIALRLEIAEQIRSDIGYGIENFGLLSDKYWLYIEKLAIKYWSDLNRQEIFVMEIM